METKPETVTRYTPHRRGSIFPMLGYYKNDRFYSGDRKNSLRATQVLTLDQARAGALKWITEEIERLQEKADELRALTEQYQC